MGGIRGINPVDEAGGVGIGSPNHWTATWKPRTLISHGDCQPESAARSLSIAQLGS
jgi:hypothetical protein